MPDFNERLETIARLRSEARQHDESQYGARVALQKTKQRLARAKRQQTISDGARDREVLALRSKMSELSGRLADLREQEREVARELEQLGEHARLLAYLQRRRAAAEQQAAELRRRIAELRRREPPAPDELERLEAELAAVA